MAYTEAVDWLEQPFEGFMVNASFSDHNNLLIIDLLSKIKQKYGDDVFVMPKDSLHITLLDWVAPLVDYDGQNKEQLFQSIRAEYDTALEGALVAVPPIKVRFTEIKVFPSTIILLGHDDGQFQLIRDTFVHDVTLLPNTKVPPQIIHSSIVRFKNEIPFEEVEAFVATLKVDITQEVSGFRLVHSQREPMLEFEVLKNYQLGAEN